MDSYGVELFDRDAVFADGDQGTKDEPICILSHAHNRIVGVTYPVRSTSLGAHTHVHVSVSVCMCMCLWLALVVTPTSSNCNVWFATRTG